MKLDIVKAQTMSSKEIEKYLKEREIRFGREYIKDGNATQAAIRAGYSPKGAAVQGSRLVRKEEIRAYRAALIRERLDDKDLTKESIAIKLSEIVDRCMQKEAVLEYNKETKEFEKTGEWTFDARGATKALESLSKLMGYDSPVKTEISITGIESELDQLEEELND